jgi:urease accessory protein
MLRATAIVPAGHWSDQAADVVCLDYDRRRRRRLALVGSGGLAFLLDLAKAPQLIAGDGLKLEDGRIVAVEAASEPLLEIACADARGLARIAWHLGNRHLACEIDAGCLYIRADHVIAAMVRGLGAAVQERERPFNPEGGAYAVAGHAHAPAGGHDHGHDHGQQDPHQHSPQHGEARHAAPEAGEGR